ncbi:MAG: cytidylate kinase family protein [Promethearchaeia archaeon]
MIITISGLHGTGKSSVGKAIANQLNYDYYSTGQAFRDLAEEKGLTLEEFSEYVENNPEIDEQLDKKVLRIAKEGDIVIDSQLGGHLLQDIADFKVLLTAPLEIRVKRMSDRDGTPYEAKLKETKIRERSEYERFKELYGYDLRDKEQLKKIYDLIVSTEGVSKKKVIEKIMAALKDFNKK